MSLKAEGLKETVILLMITQAKVDNRGDYRLSGGEGDIGQSLHFG